MLEDILQRDRRDSTRDTAPTAAANDAHVIDTTVLTPDDVLAAAIDVVHAAFLKASEE